jgi:hypothetical protein
MTHSIHHPDEIPFEFTDQISSPASSEIASELFNPIVILLRLLRFCAELIEIVGWDSIEVSF